jgi:hypothetical protein
MSFFALRENEVPRRNGFNPRQRRSRLDISTLDYVMRISRDCDSSDGMQHLGIYEFGRKPNCPSSTKKFSDPNDFAISSPRGTARDCRDFRDTNFLSRGYPARAKLIADRRVYLPRFRHTDLVLRVAMN